ncbi:bactofilin family protein [Sulfurimonas autotrophica]|uniref:bactofilin family protein n=1 Tax=Sulfurimonas autotrophica TaxID=202747 RepID=UPI0005A126C8|nr:polymer-forming cytoskeletal protein [Sulfurimonas autotrophica]
MAIFNNGDITAKGDKTDSNTAIITAGAKIKGEVELSCNLYIDGELEGFIKSSKEVNVGKNGHVKGDITTKRLVVQGLVEGSVHADRVEIKAAGHVNGEITSVELVIESKGIFEGNSIIKDTTASMSKIETGN